MTYIHNTLRVKLRGNKKPSLHNKRLFMFNNAMPTRTEMQAPEIRKRQQKCKNKTIFQV